MTDSAHPSLAPLPDDWHRALAIVAHPDDLEYGTAAAVSKWTDAGKQVAYVLASRGEAGIDGMEPGECARVREEEQRASSAVVGVTALEFLDHRDGVIEEGLPLRRDLAAAIRRHRPELILTINHHDTWGAGPGAPRNTPDHRAVGRGVLDAVGDAGNRWIFPELLEQGLLPWGGVRWTAVAGSPYPTHAEEVTENARDRAVASLAEHHAYIVGLGEENPRAYARKLIGEMLAETGRLRGTDLAVGFELVPHSFDD
ncbi:PIG-L deacetylase family protein [Streptomyces sp. CMB-StM0423]|uniref:PIG-L deacetylase family protein n=1 Tax=Streptomyces sp. CMB-StM0423 TaxID=2059884 RepID=UPI000C70619E|nr:PIG-L deacetylase family protein [Streptomyces sp. CMB-StM0423]AUH40830.1 PIG-L domain-containing protein [Streptomyces sp. CMB-StM0423]